MFDLWVGKIPGEGNGNPLQYAHPENPMDRGAWRATVMGRKESDTTEGLSTFRQQWDHVILNLYGSLNLVWVELLNSHNQVPT